MSEIIKGVGDIWCRLFDHRAFVNGNIQFLVKEFEEKRGDSEVGQLFDLLEQASELRDSQVQRAQTGIASHLHIIQDNLERALHICQDIEDLDARHRQDRSLEAAREKRKAEWAKFIDDITFKCQRVDYTFEEKEEELQEFYRDLERKLQTTT